MHDHICKWCENEFQSLSKDQKYCSRACYTEASKKQMLLICKQCGMEFYTVPFFYGRAKYCSIACTAAGRIKSVPRKCLCCGKDFNVPPRRINTAKYCSVDCSRRHQSRMKRIRQDCIICGNSFEFIQTRTHYGEVKYCSHGCYAKAITGEGSHCWKGGISFEPYCPKFTHELKEEVREAFNRECYLCGAREVDRKLAVHHCDYNKGQGCGKAWALIPLCTSCHSKTGANRHYYFNLLSNYWATNCEIIFRAIEAI
jgi:hypothetical protein